MTTTIVDILKKSSEKYGGNLAFQMRTDGAFRKFTYNEVYKAVRSLAAQLSELGARKGDRVVILSENRPEWGIAYFAVLSLGCIVVPLYPRLTKGEIENFLLDSQAAIVITSEQFRQNIPELRQIKVILSMDKLQYPDGLPPEIEISEDDLAEIVYTSGTTGKPKGVILTHKNMVSNVQAVIKVIEASEKDRLLSFLPLFHTFETLVGFLTPLCLGASITYTESLKPEKILRNAQETGATIIVGIPLFYQLFLDRTRRTVEEKGKLFEFIFYFIKVWLVRSKFGGKIRFLACGGAYLDPEVIKGFRQFGLTILQGYGLTEASPILTTNSLEHDKIGSVGRPLPGVDLKIAEPNKDGVGEIIARGPNVMKGYYKNPAATAEALKDGWLYTGDLGYLDRDGYLFITGRSKDVIVTGAGVNVYPEEIEEKLLKSPAIAEACVVGKIVKTGPRKGAEDVHAVILPKNLELDDSELIKLIGAEIQKLGVEMAEYKKVTSFSLRRQEFPKTILGKVKRFEVRREVNADK